MRCMLGGRKENRAMRGRAILGQLQKVDWQSSAIDFKETTKLLPARDVLGLAIWGPKYLQLGAWEGYLGRR